MAEELSLLEYAGSPIAEVGRYEGDDTTYQEVASWTVRSGYQGVLFEVSMMSNMFARTTFRLTTRKVALTGSLTFTNASAAVNGVGTAFTTELQAGDEIILDADETWATVSSITSDTALVLSAVYAGTGGSGASSRVYGFSGLQISAPLTLSWDNNILASATEVKLEAASDGDATIIVDAIITGKLLD